MPIPFLRPTPCRLSGLADGLREIEDSGTFSNFGPVNARFEARLLAERFDGTGSVLTVNNATIGLMMAIRAAIGPTTDATRRYAVMPSFTFAATAHAALWCGLTPLFCDIDPATWMPCLRSLERLLHLYRDQIAVMVPCATFGANLDLSDYARLSSQWGIPVVVDAAASLGALDPAGRPFAAGAPFPVVFSMHATKTFAVGEGGFVYADDPALVAMLREMANFGFGQPRSATMPGINGKLSEVMALLALAKLNEFEAVLQRRARLEALYRALLPGWTFQTPTGLRHAAPFVAVLPPAHVARNTAREALARQEIGSGAYFSPHLAEQPYFQSVAVAGALRHTASIARRILALPIADTMTEAEVVEVCDVLRAVEAAAPQRDTRPAAALAGAVN